VWGRILSCNNAKACWLVAGTYNPDGSHVVAVKPAVLAASDHKAGKVAGKGQFVRL